MCALRNNFFDTLCQSNKWGTGFFIAVKNDGSVWGTGSNVYGILGRWRGADRNSPNSCYHTAFEWVECPELEIYI